MSRPRPLLRDMLRITAIACSLIALAGGSSGCEAPPPANPTIQPTATATPTLSPAPTHAATPTSTPAIELPTGTPSPTSVPPNQRIGWIAFPDFLGGDIVLYSPDEGTVIRMGLNGLGRIGPLAWSSNWQQIAFAASRADGYSSIYVVDVGCVDLPEGCLPHVRNLTEGEPGLYGYPTWSPDGQRIAYSFRATPDPTIPFYVWVMNADGSGKTRLTDIEGSDPDWSPDGSAIAFSSPALEFAGVTSWGNIVIIIQADGSHPRRLTDSLPDSFEPEWSPDGERIVFVSTEGQSLQEPNTFTQIYTVNVDGTDLRRITGGELHGLWPSWSPDGTRIVFAHSLDGLYIVNADGSGPIRLDNTGQVCCPAWQP